MKKKSKTVTRKRLKGLKTISNTLSISNPFFLRVNCKLSMIKESQYIPISYPIFDNVQYSFYYVQICILLLHSNVYKRFCENREISGMTDVYLHCRIKCLPINKIKLLILVPRPNVLFAVAQLAFLYWGGGRPPSVPTKIKMYMYHMRERAPPKHNYNVHLHTHTHTISQSMQFRLLLVLYGAINDSIPIKY